MLTYKRAASEPDLHLAVFSPSSAMENSGSIPAAQAHDLAANTFPEDDRH